MSNLRILAEQCIQRTLPYQGLAAPTVYDAKPGEDTRYTSDLLGSHGTKSSTIAAPEAEEDFSPELDVLLPVPYPLGLGQSPREMSHLLAPPATSSTLDSRV